MKRNILIFLFILLVIPATQGKAQNEISTIDSLRIEIWPDYDRPSVLVLLTGLLPADTIFPATIILPLPKNAQLNAVARIDDRDGIMKDDILSVPGPSDMLMFITTDLQFRVEFYIPYIANGSKRSYDYSWIADISVNNLELQIQQPKAATSFKINPQAKNFITGTDGLLYHALSPKPVLAGQLFTVHLEYETAAPQLSANTLPPAPEETPLPENLSPSVIDTGTNWATPVMIIVGLIVIIGYLCLIVSRYNQMDTNEPSMQKPQNQPRVKFCRDCGEPVDKADQWCAYCGSNL